MFGTELPVEKVRIPRAAAPAWMMDPATNGIRPAFAADYEIVEGPRRATKSEGATPSAS